MRYLLCSDYLRRREFAARQAAAQAAQRLQPGFWNSLRAFFTGTTREQLHAQVYWYQAEAQRWARGREGEDLLFHTLGSRLDDRYLLLRGYPSPARRGDIDAILIGPHGLTVYEVKAWMGTYWASDDQDWMKWHKPSQCWQPAGLGSPIRQVLEQVESLRGLLYQAGVTPVPLYPMVVLTSKYIRVDFERPLSVPLAFIAKSPITLERLLGQRGAPEALQESISQQVEALLLTALWYLR
jgi:hypothetical protein